MRTPATFVTEYTGKAIAYDGSKYGVQCVGGFKVGCVYVGIPVKACPNDWAESYWTCKDESGAVVQSVKEWQTKYFDLISDYRKFKDGDWIVWPSGSKSHPLSHIAMYFKGQQFGQRQHEDNRAFCLKDTDFSDAYGALRPKAWSTIPEYDSDLTINGHLYRLIRQASGLRAVVLSPGLNKTATITDMDCDFYVYGKITGCNYFQMRNDIPDQPYGTTYGDISSPICGVYQNLPNQDSTMYYDIETGEYGDCTGVTINPEHNVFSPVLIYSPGKNVQYARMVGLGLCNTASVYCFVIRFTDGMYALGSAGQELTPNQIANDFMSIPDLDAIMFIDGGGSANMMRYLMKEGRVEYVRDTGRATAGCVALIGNPALPQNELPELGTEVTELPTEIPEEPETPEIPEDGEEEEQPMEDTAENNTVINKEEEWTDPEPQTSMITARIASLLSVKSILTLALTFIFGYLVVNQIAIPDFFTDIYKIVILFFFGYQTGKTSAGNK